jgi:hypothetical protein
MNHLGNRQKSAYSQRRGGCHSISNSPTYLSQQVTYNSKKKVFDMNNNLFLQNTYHDIKNMVSAW